MRRAEPAYPARTCAASALLGNESVKCWGNNSAGQLGLGDQQSRGAQPGEMGDTQDRGDMPGEMGDALPTVKLFSDQW